MKSNLDYFKGSIAFAVLTLILVASYGASISLAAAVSFTVSAMILAILETTVSLDNAILNATVLKHMSAFWRKMFLTVGIFIAVFAVRMVLPIMIVKFTGNVTFMDAITIPFNDPARYAQIMHDAHISILGFGATFLLMVVATYFFNIDKSHHWIHHVESKLTQLPVTPVVLMVVVVIGYFVELDKLGAYFISSAIGYGVYQTMHLIKAWLGGKDLSTAVAKNGLIGFAYLELLDASFSLDGVVAAFAITNMFIIIAAGLGIGAMFVRSMTVYLVDKETLEQYEFLEHAAYWAIAALVVIMYLGILHIEVGEIVAGLTSAAIIAAGVWSSIRKNRISN